MKSLSNKAWVTAKSGKVFAEEKIVHALRAQLPATKVLARTRLATD